ncbi:MAG: hypothetical protein PUF31_04040 [Oscillospiraceae bacterium]|nr:hypothetical protein [Oscillospiraceae bacterium]
MNAIALFKQYTTLLDEVYKNASLTSDLDGASDLARQGSNANELIIPKTSMDGLADYSRNGGYVNGDVTLTNETVKCNFDRGRMFNVDNMDNAESAGIAFGKLSGEFIRTKVVPELDAFRFATYAGIPGISTTAGATLTTVAEIIAALRAATTKMDEDEVPAENRYLYITPTLMGIIQDADTNKSREVLNNFAKITKVPQTRFYTAIEQLDGTSEGEKKGGFKKASGAADINFMVVHKPAVIQYTKHLDTKVITPETNQDADAWKFGYRIVGIADAYENKVSGIYLHKKA